MKLALLITTFLICSLSFGQTIPSKERALKDFKLKKESIEKQLKFLGIETGLKDIKVEHKAGPLRKYSIGARTYYYDHVSGLDAAYHKFILTTPTYSNGDKFILKVLINYDSYEYLNSGYRKSLGKYALRSARVSIESYEGKDLTDSKLLEELNKLSIEKGKEFRVNNKYHFTSIESVSFEKKGKRNYQGTTLFEYGIKIKGKGAQFESSGSDYIEYEIRETADIEAEYSAEIVLSKGQWYFIDYSLKETNSNIENIKKNPNVPAYISLRYKPLKEIMVGPHVSEDISIYSIKYMNDLKSLILYRMHTVPKDKFVEGELLTNLFSTEQGKSALDQFYNLRQTMSDYYLDSVKVGFASNRTQIIKGKNGQFSISYSVKRTASKELFKNAKSKGASKDKLAIIKYNAKGYYNLDIDLAVKDGKIIISDVILPVRANEIKYQNGGSTRKHPISIVE